MSPFLPRLNLGALLTSPLFRNVVLPKGVFLSTKFRELANPRRDVTDM